MYLRLGTAALGCSLTCHNFGFTSAGELVPTRYTLGLPKESLVGLLLPYTRPLPLPVCFLVFRSWKKREKGAKPPSSTGIQCAWTGINFWTLERRWTPLGIFMNQFTVLKKKANPSKPLLLQVNFQFLEGRPTPLGSFFHESIHRSYNDRQTPLGCFPRRAVLPQFPTHLSHAWPDC